MANGVHALPAELREGASEPIEILIGRTMAMAASAIALGIWEFQDGGLTPGTRQAGGDWVAELYWLRAATLGEIPDWEATARASGIRVLRENYAATVSDRMIEILVDGTLEILANVVRAKIN